MHLYTWNHGATLEVNLGEQPRGKRARSEFSRCFVALRRILGRLKVDAKNLADSRRKLVEVHLAAEAYPGVRIVYRTRLTSAARCRIVRHKHRAYTSHSLVCEV